MGEISLKSPAIITFGEFHLTNAALGALLTTIVLSVFLILVTKRSKLIPSRSQSIVEIIIQMFLDFLVGAYGSKERAKKYLPYFTTLFILLLVTNQFTIVPFINQIVTGEGDLLFRVSTADYGHPIALALVNIIASHLIALSISPIKHIGNFIKIGPFFKVRSLSDLANAFLEFFLGILDIVGEFAKIISLSSRLFGNMFAGEVMVAVIAGIASWTGYLLPIPFIALSIFSGLVQAYVFAVLALQFMAGTVTSVEDEETTQQVSQAQAF